MRQQFRPEEAEEILLEAVRRSAGGGTPASGAAPVSAERLASMAAELGIAPEALVAVLHEREAGVRAEAARREEAKLRELFIGERRHDFVPHAIAFFLINLLLVGINVRNTPDSLWSAVPLLAWGVGFAIHAWQSLPTRGPAFEASFERWLRKREKRARRDRGDDDD